jgi:uracil-DNA glycosylase family 4
MSHGSDADRDCPRCPRLVAFRESWRARQPDWFNAPVRSFGSREARLLIVGLAPGLQGANRTGRPFTGDYAGDLLYATLLAFGFASGTFLARPDDGLTLRDARITNAVRCVPPENKPNGQEIAHCRDFLRATLAEMPNLAAIVALGRIAHDTTTVALGRRVSSLKFGHGAIRLTASRFSTAITARATTRTRASSPRRCSVRRSRRCAITSMPAAMPRRLPRSHRAGTPGRTPW